MNQVPDNVASAGPAPKAEHHFVEMLREFETATVITRARRRAGELPGELRGRPMAIADLSDDGTLWFITDVDSTKVLEIREDSRAMIALQSVRQFVTINGHIQLVPDAARVGRIWKESYRVWFNGKGNPELVLLRFTPFDAEYWESSGAHGVKPAFEAANAYLKSQKLDPLEQPQQ
ncbi:MAG TPA: pyridoxamine 5'-phosphate oxidase family protein [Polyangiaceae bacterium]